MSLKKVVLSLALASLTGIAWLGLSVSPAAAASPAAQMTKLDKEFGMFKHGSKGQAATSGHKGHHKHHKGHHHHSS